VQYELAAEDSSSVVSFGPVDKVEPPLVTSIAISPITISVPVGTLVQFTATATREDGTTDDVTSMVTWTSSNGSVATVNNAGVASTLMAGSTNVQAHMNGVDSNIAALTAT